jgi:magnesium chelatase family protein
MAFSKIYTGAISGIEAKLVEVEVNLDSRGFPGLTIVGLPGKEVGEAKERVRSAIKNSGYKFPDKKITVNLAPADLHKRGSLYDLPIALGILSVDGVIDPVVFENLYVAGELSLNGDINRVNGLFSLTLDAVNKFEKIIVPFESLKEVYNVAPSKIFGFKNIIEVVKFIKTGFYDYSKSDEASFVVESSSISIFSKIKGQDFAKRALQISAAGGHNLALYGPAGTGKSLLAKAICEILPKLNDAEKLESQRIHSVVGLGDISHENKRSFRSPHHSITKTGLLGGGNPIMPGEISLAHNGVLFLDEFTEFSKGVIESLRGPLEDGYINLSRSGEIVNYPSKFILICAFNPCPCGNYGNSQKACTCADHQIKKYRSKLSGPILDRIDIFVNCRYFDTSILLENHELESEDKVRLFKDQIFIAVQKQKDRYRKDRNLLFNSNLSLKNINDFLEISNEAKEVLNKYSEKFGLSARGYHRVCKISRTIADLNGDKNILKEHIFEATQYRLD